MYTIFLSNSIWMETPAVIVMQWLFQQWHSALKRMNISSSQFQMELLFASLYVTFNALSSAHFFLIEHKWVEVETSLLEFGLRTITVKMALSVRKFQIGQIVYTKIQGYPPWPSCVVDFKHENGETKAVVRYFGWNSDVWVYPQFVVEFKA